MIASSTHDGIDESIVSYRSIMRYAVPLILANSASVILQFIDRMFLAWHARDSLSGAGTAGMITISFIAFFSVTTAFTGVFVAQYMGAKRPERLGPAIWQGWYLSVAFGLITFLLSFLAVPLFDWIGHGEGVKAAEIDYFSAMMRGGIVFIMSGALMGFFIGRGDNRIVMYMQLGGIVINTVLDYAMIFGKLGFPAWGVSGAAWATVISQIFVVAAAMTFFWCSEYRQRFATWSGRRFEPALMLRILRYGSPSGLRVVVELVMWSIFLSLIGLLGEDELAASTAAFTINNVAWQPMIGISMAVSMLVGRSQGAARPDLSRTAMKRGLLLTQCWESLAALLFILFPGILLGIFFRDLPPDEVAVLMQYGRILLWFVAAYCLLDGLNVVFAQGLIGAGDSWWISKATMLITAIAIVLLFVFHWADSGLYGYWLVATVYVGASGLVWLWRYLGSAWESMKVVETVVVEPVHES